MSGIKSVLLLFPLFSTAVGQLKLIDLAYSPFSKGPPNAGFMQVYLTGSDIGFPGETTWYSVCTSGPQSPRALAYAFCVKYGYFSGTVHEIVQSNPQMPCANVACKDERSNLADCSVNINRQWSAKKILYVICYQDNSSPLGQPFPGRSARSSINCDFENGPCGWDLNTMQVLGNGLYYQFDATMGSADGHVLAPNCPTSWSSWTGQSPAKTEAAVTSPWLDRCLGFTRYCFTFSAFVPLGLSWQPTLNISVLDASAREVWSTLWTSNGQQQWLVYRIGLTASTPFRLRIRTTCFGEGQPSSLFLDDFMLTTGECPPNGRQCFNYGKEKESNHGDRFCECQNGWTMGRWCELTACGSARSFRGDFMKALLIAYAVLSLWALRF